MAEKILKSRIINKHDLEVNWLKATNFAPMIGEIAIYDPDATHAYSRFKIGDGVTNINALPFIEALPWGNTPHTYLITDADGNRQWLQMTHYETETNSLIWDGEPTSIDVDAPNATYYLISSTVPAYEHLTSNATLTLMGETENTSVTLTADNVVEVQTGVYCLADSVYVVTAENVNYNNALFERAGVYAFVGEDGVAAPFELTISGLMFTSVKTLDEKYIPATIARVEDLDALAELLRVEMAETVDNAVSVGVANLVNSAPETLDTLGEIATALEENADVVEVLEKAVGESVKHVEQELTEEQQMQARQNIGVEFATDEEVMAAMLEADIIPAIETENGALLSSAENTILIM